MLEHWNIGTLEQFHSTFFRVLHFSKSCNVAMLQCCRALSQSARRRDFLTKDERRKTKRQIFNFYLSFVRVACLYIRDIIYIIILSSLYTCLIRYLIYKGAKIPKTCCNIATLQHCNNFHSTFFMANEDAGKLTFVH